LNKKRFLRLFLRVLFGFLLMAVLLGSSSMPPGDTYDRARAFTRSIEFDYVSWTLDALGLKSDQIALGTIDYLSPDKQHQIVKDYLDLVALIQRSEAQLNDIYADPKVSDPQSVSASLRDQLHSLYKRRELLQPVAEAVVQEQVSKVAASLGLTLGGQPVPPVLFHSTPLPLALIISPRDEIRQVADISLQPGLSVDHQAALEEKVDKALDVSSLVVPVGGVGLYPTMVQQTTNLNWLFEVVAHEWTHNFLTLRPLGISYMNSPQLRTMNETTASIAGKEIGQAVIERYYPELVPPPSPGDSGAPAQQPAAPVFDFNAEMRITRVNVDKMLAESQIDQAEKYMEARRVLFWDNGYHIRKLNQAYFAFYGAYADQPGGAAGEDPVGAAVRALRGESPDLAAFLNRISWMWTFEQLQQAVGSG
jgi:hypothetical protein